MMRFNTLITMIALFISGTLGAQITLDDSIYSGGMYRNYKIYIPTAYDGITPAPLLFNLHGYSSDNFGQALYANFNPIADTAGFITVLPNGTLDGFGLRFWNCFVEPGSGVDDVQFISDLIDSISAQYLIDAERIYSTGMSNGGFMSYALACELSERITAVASVTGTIDKDRLSYCAAEHNIPVLHVHGTADPTVPYNGNPGFYSVDSVMGFWKAFNHTDVAADFQEVPDLVTTDGCTAEHYIWDNGWAGSRVELYKIIGGEHTWPGTAITFLGVTNQDVNACREIWKFFSQYTKSSLTAIAEAPVEISIQISPNPVQEQCIIRSAVPFHSIQITDMHGRLVCYKQCVASTTFELMLPQISAGIYAVHVFGTDDALIGSMKMVKE